MHIHDVYCIATVMTHRSGFRFVLVGYFASSSLYLVYCLLLLRLLRSVVLVIASCGVFCVEVTPFGMLLVIVATITIGCAGFR